MASSPVKRKALLQENQPERKKSKLSNGKNTFSYLNGKCFGNLLSNANIKIPYFRDQTAPESNFKI